jgi:uncharacterized protein
MILPDVSVLIHAYNADSAVHRAAQSWWAGCLAGTEGIGLAWVTMLGFTRITTNRRAVARPLPVHDAMAQIQTWLDLPHVHIAQPSDTHVIRLRAELERIGTAGNLTTDATWRCSPWSAVTSSIQPTRISPDSTAFAGSTRASEPRGSRGGCRASYSPVVKPWRHRRAQW